MFKISFCVKIAYKSLEATSNKVNHTGFQQYVLFEQRTKLFYTWFYLWRTQGGATKRGTPGYCVVHHRYHASINIQNLQDVFSINLWIILKPHIGGFEQIYINLLKSAAFSLQTSENILKPPPRINLKGTLRLSNAWPLEVAMYINLYTYGEILGGIPKMFIRVFLLFCTILKKLMVSDKIIHKAFRMKFS